MIEGLDTLLMLDDWLFTGVGVSGCMGFTSEGLERDSSLL